MEVKGFPEVFPFRSRLWLTINLVLEVDAGLPLVVADPALIQAVLLFVVLEREVVNVEVIDLVDVLPRHQDRVTFSVKEVRDERARRARRWLGTTIDSPLMRLSESV